MNKLGNKQEMVLARHLHDRDELLSKKFDNELLPGQEEKARIAAEKILQHCKELRLAKIVMYSSTRLRALETAKKIEDALLKNSEGIDVELRPESALRELDQGDINLPEGFKDGDYFQPLSDAWEIFFKESFDNNNLFYRFGDPLVGDGNTASYEKLRGVFSSYGECYAQFAERIYDFLVRLGKDLEKQKNMYESVLVMHSASFSVIRDLSNISKKVDRTADQLISFGILVREGWDEYQRNKSTRHDPDFGEAEVIDVTSLMKPEILDQIATERDLLKIELINARKD